MRIVIALGGNALLRRGEPMNTDVQRNNVRIAAGAIAPLAAGHSIVVVHGNGPQVGLLSLQAESYAGAAATALSVLEWGPGKPSTTHASVNMTMAFAVVSLSAVDKAIQLRRQGKAGSAIPGNA